ncbi:putative palmitoyltransferase ZDHHC13 isoform X3 [Dermacentor variabilis]|uniref:putative palmitoyltransferase ZDHHC13 isoform X3 n=1 Tax=Dermacentor variabilis TaxID=34621 RepID=UPI003F5BFFCC
MSKPTPETWPMINCSTFMPGTNRPWKDHASYPSQLSTTLGDAKNGNSQEYISCNKQEFLDAWNQLGGMTATTAMDEYVAFVRHLFPDWRPEETKSSSKSMLGAVVSRPCWEPGVAPENKDAFDWTKEGCLERLTECLNNSTSVHERDAQGMCMLHWACDRGHLEIVELLLDRGADPEAKFRLPITSFLRRATLRQPVTHLDSPLPQDEEGQTPLHYASSCGHLQVAELLLKRGAQRDTKDVDGQTPAQVALSPELETLLSPS